MSRRVVGGIRTAPCQKAPGTGSAGAMRIAGSCVSHARKREKGALRVFSGLVPDRFMVETSAGSAGYYLVLIYKCNII